MSMRDELNVIRFVRRVAQVMSACRLSRLLALKYWHEQVSTGTWETSFSHWRAYWDGVRREVVGFLEENLEQVGYAMRVDELKARA